MATELVHIGFGNILEIRRLVAIVSPNAAPTKRLVQERKSAGRIIDMTGGRHTKAVLAMDSGHVVLAALAPETIARRVNLDRAAGQGAEAEGAWTETDGD